MINSTSKKEQLEVPEKEIDLQVMILLLCLQKQSQRVSAVNEKNKPTAESYAQVSGKRLFIQPNY
jgi:hypothetical protein